MLVEKIKKIVEEECKKDTNYFGYRAWKHIQDVSKFGKILAEKLNVDGEIIEIAALLHDYASIKDYRLYKNHHIHGAEEAERILKRFHYSQDKIKQVKHCIYSHRASKDIKRKTLEAEIIASADAMSHFEEIPDLYYLAFVVHKMDIYDGCKYVKEKIERGWTKIMPEGKKIVKEKYEAINKILEDVT